ncbi:MAG TPA: CaiB/BaiF CoA-transferase family protein [Steroidobacteraceae bacterium]|nr:CaiB/BaiF CoA-transferase family protein [Steroidobacteraceae bacterium]
MGPLQGFKIIEFAGIGPGPFCAMLLADMGAEIIRIDRSSAQPNDADRGNVSARGRRSIALDLKKPQAVAAVLRLCRQADGLIEGFRPGVMERLGLGPSECLRENPRLVYGRMTGWGQTGPLSHTAGHDINYLAISGSLYMLGRANEKPAPPLNLVADMGGGGMLLAFGMVCALLERQKSGHGQSVDAAMVEGAALLATSIYARRATGFWRDERGSNLLDTGAHFYEIYETSDRRYVAVGAIEPQFYAALLKGMGLDAAALPQQMERARWPQMKALFADVFRSKTRAEWTAIFDGTDACVAPVLSPLEAAAHEHNRARGSFTQTAGVLRPAAAPRFSRTALETPSDPPLPGEQSEAVLADFGFAAEEIALLRRARALT